MATVILLICSNAFMTVAWYGHLRFKSTQLIVVILASWLIALPEYALQVPANRIGHAQFSAPQLKIIQEVISICVFLVFSFFYLNEVPRWNDWAAFALIVGAVVVMLYPRMIAMAAA
ncbi:MAG TPA: DMT family protein [Pirellulales bacterium]